MNDIMMDLETLGTVPGCAIRSIGAVLFDPETDKIGADFYVNIDRQSCIDLGMHVDPRTEAWWARQAKAAQDALLIDPVPLPDAVRDFHKWFNRNAGYYVWSHGLTFDVPIWEHAARLCKLEVPWKFFNAMDTRTAHRMGNFDVRTIQRKGTFHNALDDARHQAVCVQRSWRRVIA